MILTMEDMNNLYDESDHNYAHNMHIVSRKRSRDEDNHRNFNQLPPFNCKEFTFLGQDFSSYLQKEKLEVDRFITHHMEKVRLEVEHYRKRLCRTVMGAIEQSMMNKWKAKEEEIQIIRKINFALQDRINSLCLETRIWRELAQTNQAKVNALQVNLQQVIQALEDQSCCGSNNEYVDEVEKCQLVNNVDDIIKFNGKINGNNNNRGCKNCGKEEACVLLPCRHLCLCAVCRVSVHVCPVCNCALNFSLHVNMSS